MGWGPGQTRHELPAVISQEGFSIALYPPSNTLPSKCCQSGTGAQVLVSWVLTGEQSHMHG